ncbi:unnamed protein product [Orchesella dallaii]|uniref:Uncharacterized protein n=1 Tax=Orchesella dallaii TaxID=48710 RepID=A0ABP1Q590_9HEXA
MSTTEGDEPEEKKYCCGNSAQNEAGYVSKCDIVIAVYGVIVYILLTVLTFLSRQTVLDFAHRYPSFREVEEYYLNINQLYQILFVTCATIWHLYELGLAILLLKASTDRNDSLLKLWSNMTIVTVFVGIIISGVAIFYTQERSNLGTAALVYYLYKWYGLWICLELRREIKLGMNPYALPSDF